MALIIKNREVVEDSWHVVRAGEDGTLPAVDALLPGQVIVPFTWWKEHKTSLGSAHKKEPIGIWLAPDDEPAELVDGFSRPRSDHAPFPHLARDNQLGGDEFLPCSMHHPTCHGPTR